MTRKFPTRHSLPMLRGFEALYKSIPEIQCKGLCQDSCKMVPMSQFEWDRLVVRHGKVPGPRIEGACPFLTTEGKCQHHDIRPTLCRLYGQTDGMECPHGCTDAYLMESAAFQILDAADRIGGGPVPDQCEIVIASIEKAGK